MHLQLPTRNPRHLDTSSKPSSSTSGPHNPPDTMFDSTGIVEVFCQRIDSGNPHPQYSSPPLLASYEDGECTTPNRVTQECFILHVFLMERFDWMSENALRMAFSLDDGPAEAVEYISRPNDRDFPPKPRAEDEIQFHDNCFEGHWRLALATAELQPVNCHGCPLAPQEHDVGQIVITLQRGRKAVEQHPKTHQDRAYFVPATGAAGFPINVLFHYETTYKGIVHTTKTITYVQSTLPKLELTRRVDTGGNKRDRSESHRENTEIANGSSAKRQKLDAVPTASSEGRSEEESSYHGPLSPYWSEPQ
ncbi:hypothetical protein CKM354_000072500 [Cercospora kikuchii]|uniref:Uncharacterized protein n=2 Tax=Cercospora kikuchii TaxID=84275 RepID=A0A9P3C5W8_9PEZI|nr:uncharacterized protein CKM354_000072500 [Cercospora kikuchii]GIZ37272.1 hypothetical protein CKM354_000072500 [Cercospora kikuchii]